MKKVMVQTSGSQPRVRGLGLRENNIGNGEILKNIQHSHKNVRIHIVIYIDSLYGCDKKIINKKA